MKEKITPHLRAWEGVPAIRSQYWMSGEEADALYNDPLQEDAHEVVKGLVHKYPNRGLIKVSWQCAAHCRFCTRIRQIGKPEGTLEEKDIQAIAAYLHAHPEIEDVILSGGDPLYTPQLTAQVLTAVSAIPSVKVLRIGTRLPLQLPGAFDKPLLQHLLAQVNKIGQEKPFYLLLHVAHPSELTPEVLAVIRQLRGLKVTLLSQTVFLQGINDEFEVLEALFRTLYHHGVQPYYLYRCDRVKGLERFYCDPQKEKAIARRLRESLSGIACPLFIEDVENGNGKWPVMW